MLSTYFLCLLVGLSAASDYAWKSGTEYQYQVRGRTLASLHQVDNQYAGVVLKAQFIVRPKGDGVLYGRLQDTQYAQVHAKLPGGWKSQIPESQLAYRPVQMSNKPFEIIMKNGTVQELIVDKAIPNWEANIIKSVISQIQVDVQGENMIKSRYNQPAERDSNSYSAEFKTMEDTVTGKCETLYDIDELPEYILQSEPQLAPLPHLKADGEFIDVMKEGNKQLYACRNVTARANYLDRYNFDIKYENVSPFARNLTYKLYSYARHAGFAYFHEDAFQGHGKANQINIQAEFEPDFQSVNVSIESQKMQTEFNDIRVNKWAKALFAVHPVFNVYERVAGVAQAEVFNPTCVIDQNRVDTFDNKSYPIDLGKTWHVQMHYRVHNAARQEEDGQDNGDRFNSEDDFDYVVLVRDSGNKQKDVKITINDEKNYYEIDMIPASGSSHSGSQPAGQVLINQQPIKFDDKQSYDVEDDLIQVYALPNGDVKVEINGDFYVIYDGERVKLTATEPEQFRGEIRGLCGTFDGEEYTDFLTPRNCVLRNPYEFAASYAILDGSSQGPAKERQARAKQAACYTPEVEGSSSCSKQQTQYVEEDNGQTLCFTVRPLPVCRSGCQASKKIVKNVEVHCVQKSNVSQLWKNQIEKGASPDFSLKPVTKSIKIKVAQSCHA
ncbi:hypothetical protein CBL_10149 [Carabus blaptoides fortunei]